jgi:hypothetical protein
LRRIERWFEMLGRIVRRVIFGFQSLSKWGPFERESELGLYFQVFGKHDVVSLDVERCRSSVRESQYSRCWKMMVRQQKLRDVICPRKGTTDFSLHKSELLARLPVLSKSRMI